MKTNFMLLVLNLMWMNFSFSQGISESFHSWAIKPPMGWNSYDCFGAAVNEEEIRAIAKMMEVHLKDAGWEYVVIDYCWYYPHVGALNNPPQTRDFSPSLSMDQYGRLLPAVDRFPSAAEGKGFKEVGDYIHNLELKFGIHVMRGIPREAVARKLPVMGTNYTADQVADINDTCNWLNTMYGLDMSQPGAQEYYNSLFELYASWGVDYVKVDDIASPYAADEIEAVRKAIDHCARPMVLSLSPGGRISVDIAEHVKANANLWRISGDFWDNWEKLKEQFELVHNWEEHIGSGHWPDADMIPIGMLNRRGPGDGTERRSNFTDTEKYTLMTLWAICRSPLIYGGDLQMMRPLELKLLTNNEVISVNQNSQNNHQLFREGTMVVWVADAPESQEKYFTLFNLGDENATLSVKLEDLGFNGSCVIRDLWKHEDIGRFSKEFSRRIVAHGSGLYRIRTF